MKTATEYDCSNYVGDSMDIDITCPECGTLTYAIPDEWKLARCRHGDHEFKLLPLDEVLKQAKEKREKPFHVVANEMIEEEQEMQAKRTTYVCTAPTREELKRVEEAMYRHSPKIEPGHDPVSPPTQYKATGVEAIVCQDIADRQGAGVAKYGTTVEDNPLDLREWLQHAYEECLDQAVYLRRAIYEMDNPVADDTKKIEAFYGVRQYIDREIQRLEGGAE